jgi:acetolactate synthase-1/2/3 large subunit
MKIKLSKYIAEYMVAQGICHNFTVTGGGAMHLNDAFGHQEGMQCIYNHHEQACAIAAEGYARLSGKIALVCVTSGPGGTNAITGVLGGWLDSIPMFIISGQVKRETTLWSTDVPLRQLGDQEYNIIDSVRPMTKYAEMVTNPMKIRYHLEKAMYLATNGRPGPVWLDIPLDVQAAMIETDDLVGFSPDEELFVSRKENPVYDEKYTARIIEQIKKARRPVILAGTGIRLAGAYEEFLSCVDKLQIPVVTAWNAHDLLPVDHPLFAGKPGTVGTRGGNFVVQNCDLLIVLGCRMNIRMISYNKFGFAKEAYKIQVDIDENELHKPTVAIDMPIHANVKDVMTSLAAADYTPSGDSRWLEWCRGINTKYPATKRSYYDTAIMNPYAFMTEAFAAFEENEHIVCGNGAACVITFQACDIKPGQRLFTNSGCAAMGYGFPAAIGAAVADGGKRVVCIDGDGSFQMNIQELQTVVYNKLNLKIVYLNNNGYHSIRQTQTNLFQPPMCGVCDGNGISFPDAEKIADAYGVPFVRITEIDKARTQMEEVLATEGPVFCEVVVDPGQNFEPKLSSKVLPDGKIVSPDLDDMFPFLDREEYEQIRNEAQAI